MHKNFREAALKNVATVVADGAVEFGCAINLEKYMRLMCGAEQVIDHLLPVLEECEYLETTVEYLPATASLVICTNYLCLYANQADLFVKAFGMFDAVSFKTDGKEKLFIVCDVYDIWEVEHE